MKPVSLAVIGGTGFYAMDGLREVERIELETPYGEPSDAIHVGELHGVRVAFLARHGSGHRLLPSEIPQRANIWALAELGVEEVVAVGAVGSLRAEIAPGDIVLPDQLIDRTHGQRPATFFGDGVVAHVSLADPFCVTLGSGLAEGAAAAGARVHRGGAIIVIEGPSFSTRAESLIYQAWGASIIGMTTSPEAKLAREAGMCYASLACVTDYDAWRAGDAVSVGVIMANLAAAVESAKATVRYLVEGTGAGRGCVACKAQPDALVTSRDAIQPERRAQLRPILQRYYGQEQHVDSGLGTANSAS